MGQDKSVAKFIEVKKGKPDRQCPFCLGVRKYTGDREVILETSAGRIGQSVDMYKCGSCRKISFLFPVAV